MKDAKLECDNRSLIILIYGIFVILLVKDFTDNLM